MKDDFFVFGTNKMIDNMGGGCVSTRVAEPFGANQAFYDRRRVVYPAVTGKKRFSDRRIKIGATNHTCRHGVVDQPLPHP